MTSARIDLQELSRRENEQTEWKENVADIDDVVATLAAFANDLQNMGGGYVVCGAKETRDEHGFPRLVRTGLTANRLKEVENTVLARCRDRVAAPIAPLVEELDSDTPDRRLLVFLQPATGSAHTFRPGNEGAKHFVRVSRATIEARNGLLMDLLVRKGVHSVGTASPSGGRAREPWDRRPCDSATESDLDLLVLPGGLPHGVTLEELNNASSGPMWRNQTLAWFLSRLGYAEAEGQGLQTIQASMKNTGCPPPEYRADPVRVLCTLRAHPRASGGEARP